MGRSFSFSDASANVDLSALALVPAPEHQVWTKTFDFGYRHYQIRRIQSGFYQDLHQSRSEPFDRPYEYIWHKWHEIENWYLAMPTNVHQDVNILARLERVASYIMLLAPCPRVPKTCQLAQSLSFEYCIEYSTMLRATLNADRNIVWLLYPSAMRASKVARIFVENVNANDDRLLAGQAPRMDDLTEAEALDAPQYSYPPRNNNRERTQEFLYNMSNVLDVFEKRLGISRWLEDFRTLARPIHQRLF